VALHKLLYFGLNLFEGFVFSGVLSILMNLIEEQILVKGVLELFESEVFSLIQIKIPADLLQSSLYFRLEVYLVQLGSLEVFNHIDILKLLAYLLNDKVAFDVFDTVLFELVVEQSFYLSYFALLTRNLFIYHDDRKEETVLLFFSIEKCHNNLLQLLVLNVRNIYLKL
jgi:hypothetical protein